MATHVGATRLVVCLSSWMEGSSLRYSGTARPLPMSAGAGSECSGIGRTHPEWERATSGDLIPFHAGKVSCRGASCVPTPLVIDAAIDLAQIAALDSVPSAQVRAAALPCDGHVP